MSTEIRKIPKKTSYFIGLIIVLGIVSFFLASVGKVTKATKILNKLGMQNITDVKVYASQEFLREDINVKGMKYTVSFTNLDTNEECKGFVLRDYKDNVEKDLLCKKRGN